MTPIIEWQPTGPLGFPSSKNYRYWVPTCPDGTFRAWFHFRGLPGSPHDKLLGDGLPSIEEAKRLCEEHARVTFISSRLELHQFLSGFGSEWFVTEDDFDPPRLEDLRDEDPVLFTEGTLVFQGSEPEEVPNLLSVDEVHAIVAASPILPTTPLAPLFRKWRAIRSAPAEP